ncbi:hypothetical protein GQ600_6958 [Phytophthora cactorum]|nr:hypothetical protein GQ600_6958 [Phytophthora cactorum]
MFALHPEKIPSVACKFGSSTAEICGFKLETTTAFDHLKVQLGADTNDLAEDVIDSLSDAEYDLERRQVTVALLQGKSRTYRKRVEKHLASVALHAANFQGRQEKTQAARDEEFAKLEKLFADIESKGPCTTYEEFMESEKHHRTKSPVDGE